MRFLTVLCGVIILFIAFHALRDDGRVAEQRARLQSVADQLGAKRKMSDAELLEMQKLLTHR